MESLRLWVVPLKSYCLSLRSFEPTDQVLSMACSPQPSLFDESSMVSLRAQKAQR